MPNVATKLPIKTETPAKSGRKAMTTTAAAAPPWASFDTLRREFDTLRREIDDVFENFGSNSWLTPFSVPSLEIDFAWPRGTAWGIAPAVDLSEKDKEYKITAELPGLDEKDVEIKVANGMLTIKGEKKEEREEHEKDYYLSERSYGSFMRSFGLPKNVDADKIEATFAKGVLTITMPKTAEALKSEKKIAVKAA